jgi:hypothetical protein
LMLLLGIVDVSTRSAPGRELIGKDDACGVVSIGVATKLGDPPEAPAEGPWLRFAVIRARSEVDEASAGSLFVLAERERPPGLRLVGGGVPSAPGGAPPAGSSVWMKQQRLP